MSENKPRVVKAKITRTVTEIARVRLTQDGSIDEIIDVLDELDYSDAEIATLVEVFDAY